MKCEAVITQLPLLLYGELSIDEQATLQQHIDECAECRVELDRTRLLHGALDKAELDVDPVLLTDCRRNLRMAAESVAPPRSFWWDLRPTLKQQRAWSWFAKPVRAMGLIAIGFFGSGLVRNDARFTTAVRPGLSDPGSPTSRVQYIEPRDSGKVQIVVEETRERVLSGNLENEDIRALVLRATRESPDPGIRLETLDLLKGQSHSQEVRSAILHALRTDSDAGVRLKALEALRPSAGEEDTQRVLTEVLLKDDNPGVRTHALDLLTDQSGPDTVGVLQEVMSRERNTYVRMKLRRALSDMNASAEPF